MKRSRWCVSLCACLTGYVNCAGPRTFDSVHSYVCARMKVCELMAEPSIKQICSSKCV